MGGANAYTMHEYKGKINCGNRVRVRSMQWIILSGAHTPIFPNLITNIILHIHIDTYLIYNHKRTSHIIFQLRAKSFYCIHFWFDDSMWFIFLSTNTHTHTHNFIFFSVSHWLFRLLSYGFNSHCYILCFSITLRSPIQWDTAWFLLCFLSVFITGIGWFFCCLEMIGLFGIKQIETCFYDLSKWFSWNKNSYKIAWN